MNLQIQELQYKEEEDCFRVVRTAAIPEVSEVRFYESTIQHIHEHTELNPLYPSLEHAILDTISKPTAVYTSTSTRAKSWLYSSDRHIYQKTATLTVVVKSIEGTSGLLKTAYFSNEKSGEPYWISSDNDND